MVTIAVTSGKGGVGKSSLSVNLGVALSQMGYRTVVFDADLSLANVEVLTGRRAELTLQHVIAEQKSVSEVVQPGPGGLGIIAGGSGIPNLMRSGPKRLGLFFDQVQELASDTDVLLYDTSAGLDNKVLAFVKQADKVLLVTTPEPASVTDAYATIKTVFRQKPEANIKVCVNMARDEIEARGVFGVLKQVTKDFLGKDVEFAGHVRRDDAVGIGARERSPYVMAKQDSPAKADTVRLAASLVEGCTHGLAVAA